MARTLSSANSALLLTVSAIGISAVEIQGYDVDEMFDLGAIDTAETRMGADGVLSAGFVYTPVDFGITLQADSPSIDVFEMWYAAELSAADKFRCSMTLSIPGIGKKYNGNRGVLMNYKPAPSGKKILQPSQFKIVYETVLPSLL